ncbi:hypothetical protein JCM10049v2_001575 [Rhodotorula toruloides]
MTAIKSFIEGKFAAVSHAFPPPTPSSSRADLPNLPQVDQKKKKFTYSTMEPQARQVFDSKRLRYGFYRELSDAQEREIFKRVQLGKALDKGEIMNAITSPYAFWIHQLRQKYFSADDPHSFRPRVLSSKRGKVLTAAYVISRNLILDFDSLAQESEAKRTKNMQELPVPSEGQTQAVERAIERFKKLTLVKALPGEDAWPNTSTYQDLRDKNVPVPHRVWRLRATDVDVERTKALSTIAFAPVEIHLLPAVVQKFVEDNDLSDGELLEVVHRLRIHVHESFPGEVKDNSKTYQLVKAWVKNFDTSTLERWYNDDGSLRKSYDPSSAARRKTVGAAPQPAANGTGANGSAAQATGKKRAIAMGDSDADEGDELAQVQKKKKKEKGDRVQRSASGDPLPFSSTAANLQPGARPQPVVFGDTASSTNGSTFNTPVFGRAGAGTPAQHRPASAAQPQATPAPPVGLSAKHAKFAQRVGLPAGGVAAFPASAASGSSGTWAPSAAPPGKRQPPPPRPLLSATGKRQFDDRGRAIYVESAGSTASTAPAEDEPMDERAWGAVDFEQEEIQRVMREKEALRAQQQHQQAQPQRLYGDNAAPPAVQPTSYSSYDTSSQYRAFDTTPAASTSASHAAIKPDPDLVERQEASMFASLSPTTARANPNEARRDNEVLALLQGKRGSSREASMRPPAVPSGGRDREWERERSYAGDDRRRDFDRRDERRDDWRDDRRSDSDSHRRDDGHGRDDGYRRNDGYRHDEREDPARRDYHDHSRYDGSSSRDSSTAAPAQPRSQSRVPANYRREASQGPPARQNSGDGYGGAGPASSGYAGPPSNGYAAPSSNGYGGTSANGYGAPSASSYSNGFHGQPPVTHSGSHVASAYGARGAPLPDQNALRPPAVDRSRDPRRK